MATNTSGGSPATQSRHQQHSKNLRCGICQDVYKAPKLLPCFHSFCHGCLEQLVTVKGSPFHCPSCRKLTPVPLEGPAGFQSNMYLSEAELERARQNETVCRVHVSYDEPLTFFCVTCNDAICMRCKLTRHEGHRCEDLVKSDERSRHLGRAKRELDDMIDSLQDGVKSWEVQLKQLDAKKALLEQQVEARHKILVDMATKWKDCVLRDLNKTSEAIRVSVSRERDHLTTEVTHCCSQRKRLQEVMDDFAKDHLDVADAERVFRDCTDTNSLRKRVKGVLASSSSPSSILRPGLRCPSVEDRHVLREEDIRRFIGIPTVFKLPKPGMAMETISRFHQCLEEGVPRPVLALCVTNDGSVHCMYGDSPFGVGGGQWGKRSVSCNGQTLRDNKVGQKFIFIKLSGGDKFNITHHEVSTGVCLNAKSGTLTQLHYEPSSLRCSFYDLLIKDDPACQNQHKVSSRCCVQEVQTAGKPLAMDASKDGNLWVVLEELPQKAEKGKKEQAAYFTSRLVRLYYRGLKDCLATYQPPDPKSFTPSDVCFWHQGGKEKLLVGDRSNDLVHVISVHIVGDIKAHCILERYLAAGCGDLVQPMAFDTDTQGRLWIGCMNGWILKCEALPDTSDKNNANNNHNPKEKKSILQDLSESCIANGDV